MNYLLIEEKAWQELQVRGKRAAEKLQQLRKYFNPASESG